MIRVALLVLLAACVTVPPPAARFARKGDVITGRLELIDGGELELASLRGRPVAIHFFETLGLATFTDVDELRAARAKFPDLAIVGVGLDPNGKLLPPWRDSAQVDWFVARPNAEMLAHDGAFGDVMALAPSLVLLDRAGQVAWTSRGGLREGELARHVASLPAGR
jgi:hypothetical protein